MAKTKNNIDAYKDRMTAPVGIKVTTNKGKKSSTSKKKGKK